MQVTPPDTNKGANSTSKTPSTGYPRVAPEDAHVGVRLVIEDDGATDDIADPTKLTHPGRVTEHHHASLLTKLIRTEQTAVQRRESHHAKEVGGCDPARYSDHPTIGTQHVSPIPTDTYCLEGLARC